MEYPIEIVKEKVGEEYLKKFLGKPFEEVIKFVVDVEKGIIAVGGELHSDAAEMLTQKEKSDSRNLWGGNFYLFQKKKEDKVELISLINIKPSQNNFDMKIQNKERREKVLGIIDNLFYGK